MQEQARLDRIEAIKDRTGQDTRNTLIQFGRARALGGGGGELAQLPKPDDPSGGKLLGNLPLLDGSIPLAEILVPGQSGALLNFLRGLGKL